MQLPLKWLAGILSAFALTLTGVPASYAQINFPIPPHTVPGNITAVEYFFNTDPGFGNGTPLPASTATDIFISQSINISGLSPGVHQLYIRVRTDKGWGATNRSILHIVHGLNVPSVTLAPVVKAEYFIDTDPGPGNAVNLPITSGRDVSITNFAANIGGLNDGVHHFFIRTQDAAGSWSLLNRFVVSVVSATVSFPPHAAVQNLTALEYFFDTDPGLGNATPLNVPAGTDLQQYQFVADVSGLADGTHTLFIRSAGKWSLTNSRIFVIGSSALPVSLVRFNARREQTSVALNWQTANEQGNSHFIIQRSESAQTFDSIGMVAGSGGNVLSHDYDFIDRHPLAGTSYYRLMQVDVNGKFTYSPVIAVRMDAANEFFSVNNPVSQALLIYEQGRGEAATYQVSDLSGQVVLTVNTSGKAMEEVNVSTLPAGAYLIRGQRNGAMHQLKFIKQ